MTINMIKFQAHYKGSQKVWSYTFYASSWEEAERVCKEYDLFDLGKVIEEIDLNDEIK